MFELILRKLPVFKGKLRLGRALFKRKVASNEIEFIKGNYNCIYKIPNLKENIGFEIFINGVYEKETIEFIIHKIPHNGCFIDIGANIGAICLPVCKQRPDINAFAVEASSKVYEFLKYNIENNFINNCISLNECISDVDGENVKFYSPLDLYGKGSMTPVFTNISEDILSIKLDTFIHGNRILNVKFIKIDIEGFEYLAFKGAKKLLSGSAAPDILFEFVDWAEETTKKCKQGDAQKILINYGYKLWKVQEKGKLIPLNSIIERGSCMIFATKCDE